MEFPERRNDVASNYTYVSEIIQVIQSSYTKIYSRFGVSNIALMSEGTIPSIICTSVLAGSKNTYGSFSPNLQEGIVVVVEVSVFGVKVQIS